MFNLKKHREYLIICIKEFLIRFTLISKKFEAATMWEEKELEECSKRQDLPPKKKRHNLSTPNRRLVDFYAIGTNAARPQLQQRRWRCIRKMDDFQNDRSLQIEKSNKETPHELLMQSSIAD